MEAVLLSLFMGSDLDWALPPPTQLFLLDVVLVFFFIFVCFLVYHFVCFLSLSVFIL